MRHSKKAVQIFICSSVIKYRCLYTNENILTVIDEIGSIGTYSDKKVKGIIIIVVYYLY